MPERSDERGAEVAAAARRQVEAAELTRINLVGDEPSLRHSRYDSRLSVPTLPSGLIDGWADSSGGDASSQQSTTATQEGSESNDS